MTFWVAGAVAVTGIGSGIMGANAANSAANQQSKQAQNALNLQREMFYTQLGLQAPYRQAGLAAQQRYLTLLGLSPQQMGQYTPGYGGYGGYGGGGAYGPISVSGGSRPTSYAGIGGTLGSMASGLFGGHRQRTYGGTIDPMTGTVYTNIKNPSRDSQAEAALTNYLRTGERPDLPKGKRYRRLLNQIEQLRMQGYQYDPNAQANMDAAANYGLNVDPNAPDFGKYARDFGMADFEADPGYAFRLSEGLKAVDRSMAARGLGTSGAAIKGVMREGQGQASQEYTNAFNRYQINRSNQLNALMGLMGGGQTAATQQQQAAQNYGAMGGQAYNDLGAARASGYVGTANAWNQALGSTTNNLMDLYYLNQLGGTGSAGGTGGGAAAPAYSPYGPYATGYRFSR